MLDTLINTLNRTKPKKDFTNIKIYFFSHSNQSSPNKTLFSLTIYKPLLNNPLTDFSWSGKTLINFI